jgi:hypothetical protein
MRRIDHRAIAVEAVLTRYGTLVGPLMNDITGHPELTPYRGGWAGNDYPATLTGAQKRQAREFTRRLGDRLAAEGYVGFFEVDYLVDTGTGELYLGELNPRISGISSMTNVTVGAYADMPLFLFHLLEYLGIDYEVDVAEINERWSHEASVDVWSQIILKETGDQVELLAQAPRTGIYHLGPGGTVAFRRWGNDWHGIVSESEAFTCASWPPATTATTAPTWVPWSRAAGCRPTTTGLRNAAGNGRRACGRSSPAPSRSRRSAGRAACSRSRWPERWPA